MTKSTATKARSTALATRREPRRKSKTQSSALPRAASASIYSVHPGVALMQKWIAELEEKTGRSLDQWMRHIQARGPDDEKECRLWLKAIYGLGTNSAWWLTERAFGVSTIAFDDDPASYLRACPTYVNEMYAGPRAVLRPIHDELVRLARELEGVRICPCKTIVPLYRRHVFAEIKPASHKRIDLGLALGDEPFTSRLLDTGGRLKKNRITHRVALTDVEDIDLQVRRWLKEAYQRDA
jgi:hypothetical protein